MVTTSRNRSTTYQESWRPRNNDTPNPIRCISPLSSLFRSSGIIWYARPHHPLGHKKENPVRDLPWIRVKRRHRPLFCINFWVFWPLILDPTLIGLKCQITHSRSLWQLNWWSAYLICFLIPLECLKTSERSGPLVRDTSERIQGRVETAY